MTPRPRWHPKGCRRGSPRCCRCCCWTGAAWNAWGFCRWRLVPARFSSWCWMSRRSPGKSGATPTTASAPTAAYPPDRRRRASRQPPRSRPFPRPFPHRSRQRAHCRRCQRRRHFRRLRPRRTRPSPLSTPPAALGPRPRDLDRTNRPPPAAPTVPPPSRTRT